jgi:Uma2 family endonuclease
MALAERELVNPPVLTYEAYLMEGETPGRYEIVDGVREYMTNPASEHQLILGNIYGVLSGFAGSSTAGIALVAPCDIIVCRDPLRVRQPDLLLISFERWGDKEFSNPAPLERAPELVVEILSPSESRPRIEDKIGEYAQVGVLECWIVSPEAATVEVLKLATGGTERVGLFGPGQSFSSVTFSELSVDVASVFELPRRPR